MRYEKKNIHSYKLRSTIVLLEVQTELRRDGHSYQVQYTYLDYTLSDIFTLPSLWLFGGIVFEGRELVFLSLYLEYKLHSNLNLQIN